MAWHQSERRVLSNNESIVGRKVFDVSKNDSSRSLDLQVLSKVLGARGNGVRKNSVVSGHDEQVTRSVFQIVGNESRKTRLAVNAVFAIFIDSAVAFFDKASVSKVADFDRAISSVVASFMSSNVNAVVSFSKSGIADIFSASNIVIAPVVSRRILASGGSADVLSAVDSIIALRVVVLDFAAVLSASVDSAFDSVFAFGLIGGEGASSSLGTFVDSAVDVIVAKVVVKFDLASLLCDFVGSIAPIQGASETVVAKAVGFVVVATITGFGSIAPIDGAVNVVVASRVEGSVDASLKNIRIANVLRAIDTIVARIAILLGESASSVNANVVSAVDVVVADHRNMDASISGFRGSSPAVIFSARVIVIAS